MSTSSYDIVNVRDFFMEKANFMESTNNLSIAGKIFSGKIPKRQ